MIPTLKEAPKRPYIGQLDGLRAIAIVLVMLSHVVDRFKHPVLESLGYVGVTLFFALSGYLITSHLLEEYEYTGRISLAQFYTRRFCRILPPALFYLAVIATLAKLGIVRCDWAALKAALFFYANYKEDYYLVGWMVGQFWSLSVEEHFYLTWPTTLIFFGVLKGWRTASIMAASIAALRIMDDRYHFLGRLLNNPSLGHFHSDLIADVILWGCCLSFFVRRWKPGTPGNPWLWTAVTAAACFLLLMPSMFEISHTTIPAHILPAVIVGSVLLSPNTPIGRFLSLSPLRFIGKLSYSIYLWHTLFLAGPEPHLNIAAALAAILGCAFLSYTFIEKPFIRLGRQLIQRRIGLFTQAET